MKTTEDQMTEFDQVARAQAQRVLREYWQALEALVAREDLSTEQRVKEMERIDAIRGRIGKSGRHMHDVREDLEELRGFIVAADLEDHVELLEAEHKRRRSESQKLLQEAEQARRDWIEKSQKADALSGRAFGLGSTIQDVRAQVGGRTKALRDRGLEDPAALRHRVGKVSKSSPTCAQRFALVEERLRDIGFDLVAKKWRS